MKKSELTVKTAVPQQDFKRLIRFNRFFRVQWQIPLILLVEAYSIYQLIRHFTGAAPLGQLQFWLACIYSVSVVLLFGANEKQIHDTVPAQCTPLGRPRGISLNREGIKVSSEDKTPLFQSSWGELYRVYGTPKSFVIYLDEKQAIVLDRSRLKTDEEIQVEAILSDGMEERYIEISNKMSMKSNKRANPYAKWEKKLSGKDKKNQDK